MHFICEKNNVFLSLQSLFSFNALFADLATEHKTCICIQCAGNGVMLQFENIIFCILTHSWYFRRKLIQVSKLHNLLYKNDCSLTQKICKFYLGR